MDITDKRLVNRLQRGIPLVSAPFEKIAEEFSISEQECIERIKHLKEQKIVRQISAIFDTKSLGYKGMLTAMRFSKEADIIRAADIINRHPGVSHNYERDHKMNLWFTIAVPPSLDINRHIDTLSNLTGSEETFRLPTLKLFKIGVSLDLTGKQEATERINEDEYYSEKDQASQSSPLTAAEKNIVMEIQEDIELIHSPFKKAAERCSMSEKELLNSISELSKKGFLKRFAAVLHHKKAGFTANIMAVWQAPEDSIEECGHIMASFRAVSHCYHRPVYPGWPYSIFTMIHGKSEKDCIDVVKEISLKTGITGYSMLKTLREFKKVRIKYFTGEIERWEDENLNMAV